MFAKITIFALLKMKFTQLEEESFKKVVIQEVKDLKKS